jgi:ATP synthase delta (OSCP) subunit
MYSDILSLIKTTTESADFLQEIDLLTSGLYKKAQTPVDTDLAKHLRPDFALILKKVPQNTWRAYLSGLREAISQMRVLRLTLAIIPTTAVLQDATAWVKTNVGTDVVVETQVDPSLIGGAVVNFAGKFRDLSLKPSFEKELANHD